MNRANNLLFGRKGCGYSVEYESGILKILIRTIQPLGSGEWVFGNFDFVVIRTNDVDRAIQPLESGELCFGMLWKS